MQSEGSERRAFGRGQKPLLDRAIFILGNQSGGSAPFNKIGHQMSLDLAQNSVSLQFFPANFSR